MRRQQAEDLAGYIAMVVALLMVVGFWTGVYYVIRALIRYHAAEIAAAAVEASK